PAGRSGLAGTWIYRVMAAPGAAADALEVAHAGLHLRAAVQALGVPTTQLVGVLAAAEIDPGQRQHEGAKCEQDVHRAPRWSRLHVPEQRHERRADGEGFGPRLQPYGAAATVVADHARDRTQVDDRGAVDLLEGRRIQHRQQVLDRRAQQRLALGGDDAGVLVVGAEVGDLVDQDQPGLAACTGGQPGQRGWRVLAPLPQAWVRTEALQQAGECRGLVVAAARLQPADR